MDESPFSTFREIAYDRMGQPFHMGPWVGRTVLRPLVEGAFLRTRWRDKLDMQEVSPEDSIARTDVPVLLTHGEMAVIFRCGIRGAFTGRIRKPCFGKYRGQTIAEPSLWLPANSRAVLSGG